MSKEGFMNPYTQKDIMDNMGLVYKIVHVMKLRHTNSLLGFDDLVSEGVFGLIKALERFDSTKNVKFSTYAGRCIRYSILEAHRQGFKQYRQARKLGLPAPRYLYLDGTSLGDETDGSPNHEMMPGIFLSEEEMIDKIDATVVLKNAWGRLSPKQKHIMKLMCSGMTQKEVAEATGVTPTAVYFQYHLALDKIKNYHLAYRRKGGEPQNL